MILLGSGASRIRGDLPAWSTGYHDYDICGSKDEFESLVSYFGGRSEGILGLWINDMGNGRHAIRKGLKDRILVDWVMDDTPAYQALQKLPMALVVTELGHSMQVITAETDLVARLAYQHLPIRRENNDAWITHLQETVGEIEWTADLRSFHDHLRDEVTTAFSGS